jgi:hypothetical protein
MCLYEVVVVRVQVVKEGFMKTVVQVSGSRTRINQLGDVRRGFLPGTLLVLARHVCIWFQLQ